MEPPCEHGGVHDPGPASVYPVNASMEPPCEHGGVASGCIIRNTRGLLQWSRRVNTAECRGAAEAPATHEAASMEPPCEHGGVASKRPAPRLGVRRFNGAAV